MKILIAEDDTSLRRVLVSILQKNNYSVDAVDNGSDALDYLFISSSSAGSAAVAAADNGIESITAAKRMRNNFCANFIALSPKI